MNDTNDDGGIRAWAEQGAAEEALFDGLPPAAPEPSSKPDTTALAIRGGIGEITKALDAFDKIAAELDMLSKKYPKDLVYDLTTVKGRAEATEHRAAYRDRRTLLEKVRVGGKAPVLSLGKDIDARAAKLKADLEAGEKPVHLQIKAYEDAKAAEKQAKIDAEAGRVIAIQEALHDLHMEGEVKAGTPSAQIAERLEAMRVLVLDQAKYQEQMREAEAARALVVSKLTTALDARRYAEAEAAKLEADRAELAELRRLAAEQKRRDDEAAAAKRAADEAAAKLAADAMAEAQRKLAADQEAVRLEAARLAAVAQDHADREAKAARDLANAVELCDNLAATEAIAGDPPMDVGPAVMVSFVSGDPPMGGMENLHASDVTNPAEEATLKLGEICERLGFIVNEAFLRDKLGFARRNTEGRGCLFHESDFPLICGALVRHIHKVIAS